jgi:hypothetical protein
MSELGMRSPGCSVHVLPAQPLVLAARNPLAALAVPAPQLELRLQRVEFPALVG